MRQIPTSHSLLTFLEELEFTEAALSADPDTQDLAASFRDEIKDWEGVFKKERQARRDVVRAEAVVRVRDESLDRATLALSGQVLAAAGMDRTSSLFRRFFPEPPSALVRRGLRRQAERIRDGILPELANLEKGSPLARRATALKQGVSQVFEALDARSQVRARQGSASHDVDEWKEGVNTLRLSTYAELLGRAAKQGWRKAWAETFFRSASTAVEVEGDTEAGAGSASPAPEGGVDKPASG